MVEFRGVRKMYIAELTNKVLERERKVELQALAIPGGREITERRGGPSKTSWDRTTGDILDRIFSRRNMGKCIAT